MDILNIILIVSILIVLYFVVKLVLNSSPKETKSAEVKKEEIIGTYEKQMQDLITSYSNNNDLLLKKKTQLLKQISTELSTNIFFDKLEVKNIIQKLVNM